MHFDEKIAGFSLSKAYKPLRPILPYAKGRHDD
jgi:hypothetical protein